MNKPDVGFTNTQLPATTDESAVIRKAKAGDPRAFSLLVETYQRSVYNVCYRMLGHALEAEDAAQEAFLRAYRKLHTFDEGQKFSTWLLSIASHYCIDCLRRRRFIWTDIDDVIPVLPAERRDDQPEEALMRSETERRVQRMLSLLAPEYRSVLVLRHWHYMSYAEIAETLQLSESAVKTRIHRARKMLAEALREEREALPQAQWAPVA